MVSSFIKSSKNEAESLPEPVSPAQPPPPQLPNKSWYGIIHVPTLKSSIRTETTPEAKSSQEPQAATGSHRHLRPICMLFVTVCSPSLFCCCRLRGNTFQILQNRKNMKSYPQIRRGTVWLAPQSLQLGYLQTLLHWSDSRALVKGCQGMSRANPCLSRGRVIWRHLEAVD